MRHRWTEQDETRLLDLVSTLAATRGGLNAEVFNAAAKEFGISYDAVTTKFWKLRNSKGVNIVKLPESRYAVYDRPFEFEGDALVLCDPHIPLHHAEFINTAIRMAASRGIRRCVIGGDCLDMKSMSHWPDSISAKPKIISNDKYNRLKAIAESLPEGSPQKAEILAEIEQSEDDPYSVSGEWANARGTLTALAKNFDEVFWMMGNHEDWLIRKLEKSVSGADLGALFCGGNPKFKISEVCWMQFTSGGKLWQVEHPNLAAKGGSKRLAPKYRANIIMAHNHHFALASDTSGEYLAIEPGMCGDERRMSYASRRHNAADMHVLGAVIIQGGRPFLINKYFMDL